MTTELMTDETSRSHVCTRGVYCGTPEPCAKKKKKKNMSVFKSAEGQIRTLSLFLGKTSAVWF